MARTLLVVTSAVGGILLLVAASSVDADVITDTFDTAGTPGSGDYTSSDTEPNSTASEVTGGGCSLFTIGTGAYVGSPGLMFDEPYGNTEQRCFDLNIYAQWTVTADAGYELDLDNLTWGSIMPQAGGTREWFLYSDVDGFTVVVDRIATGVVTNYTPDTTALEPFSVDLSAAKFQDLDNITFHMYAHDGWYNAFFFDNIRLNGTVPTGGPVIPEPGTALLLGTGLLGLVGFLRRRRMT